MFLLVACGKTETANTDKSPAKQTADVTIGKILAAQGVLHQGVKIDGSTVTVTYETSSATYDDQVIADWGTIFGTVAQMKYDKITILNTVNGVSYAAVTSSSDNALSFIMEKIDENAFWSNVEINVID
ncbi:hypothetical protein J4457_05900 [Candidatus Woesearchaeota archaeon]|nr:hypothetical protein [Candidatus Woesearchaeota archaeon]